MRGRAAAEALMVDQCRVESNETIPGAWDPEKLDYGPGTPVYSYEGPCRLKFSNTAVSEVDSVSQQLIEQGAVLSLPISTSGLVEKDHVATMTAVDETSGDTNLIGKQFRIEGPHHQTFATARRFTVEEVS